METSRTMPSSTERRHALSRRQFLRTVGSVPLFAALYSPLHAEQAAIAGSAPGFPWERCRCSARFLSLKIAAGIWPFERANPDALADAGRSLPPLFHAVRFPSTTSRSMTITIAGNIWAGRRQIRACRRYLRERPWAWHAAERAWQAECDHRRAARPAIGAPTPSASISSSSIAAGVGQCDGPVRRGAGDQEQFQGADRAGYDVQRPAAPEQLVKS